MAHNSTAEPRYFFENADDASNTPTPDELMRGYREMAYALLALAFTDDTPEQLRANPQIHFFAGEVLGLDVAVLLDGMARRTDGVKFPKVYGSHGSNHNNERGDDSDEF